MALATRHRDEALPQLSEPTLVVRRESDPLAMAALQGRPADLIQARFAAGHRAYVADWEGQPAAWGWVAARTADIGELGFSFRIPDGERYLWNFVTLPSHRGRGVYPRLLRGIMEVEAAEAERFWIVYAPENHASARGIAKAGFSTVAELAFAPDGTPAIRAESPEALGPIRRLLALPERTELSACWRCIRAGKTAEQACREGRCCCDYQRPEVDCEVRTTETAIRSR